MKDEEKVLDILKDIRADSEDILMLSNGIMNIMSNDEFDVEQSMSVIVKILEKMFESKESLVKDINKLRRNV